VKWSNESFLRLVEQYEKTISVKSESIFFYPYHLPAKCIMVSGTRQQVPVSGTRNKQCVINFTSLCWSQL